MSKVTLNDKINRSFDIFIIGGGINGCGIARDAAGRGLTVALAEMNDLGSATSSASTKLFHGGLRYLEFFKFRLVREALMEREILLQAMPHISWPLRFVLPYHNAMRFEGMTPLSKLLAFIMPWMKGRRPAWLIRLGLFLYDHLGGRKILPGTLVIDLTSDHVNNPLDRRFTKAFEYSDCWVEDARLVVLNARDAQKRGGHIMTRTKVVWTEQHRDHWMIHTENQETGEIQIFQAKFLINATGPWVEDVIRNTARIDSSDGLRLVRGSHIVTRKLYDHDKCYLFQGEDGRIIFTLPYEGEFTLIGTTDIDHSDPHTKPECSPEECTYLCHFASRYFRKPVQIADIVWTYSGVRPLYNDGADSATSATRDYVLRVDAKAGAPVLSVFGGKITTYRKLAESALEDIAPFFPSLSKNWTARVSLPGGDFPVDGFAALIDRLKQEYDFLAPEVAHRLIRTYGTDAFHILGSATKQADLGTDFGVGIYACELVWAVHNEWVCCVEDFIWRRTKLGLRLDEARIKKIETFIQSLRQPIMTRAAHELNVAPIK